MTNEMVLILDFGGQLNQSIARWVREYKVYCEVLPYTRGMEEIKTKEPKGIILIGNINNNKKTEVYNEVIKMDAPILNIVDKEIEEVSMKEPVKDFLYKICKFEATWTAQAYIEAEVERIKNIAGDKKVLCALSGGVDSSVAAVLVHKAIGDNLTCVFVDHGLLRKDEGDQVEEVFKNQFNMNFIRVNAKDRFLGKLAGQDDPEKKRKIIGEEFIRVFEEEAKKLGQIDYLVQGTLYSDVIASGTETTGAIKSHHNVGGLPEDMEFQLIEPFHYLFKDEVRAVGTELGLAEEIVWRQPFPGPGLAVRILGEITEEKIEIVRAADAIVREEIKNAGLDRDIWQYFAVLPGIQSVGMKNDERTYSHTIGIRAIISADAMTANWAKIPYEVLEKMSKRITDEVEEVNRVVYDITAKPPATVEWE